MKTLNNTNLSVYIWYGDDIWNELNCAVSARTIVFEFKLFMHMLHSVSYAYV